MWIVPKVSGFTVVGVIGLQPVSSPGGPFGVVNAAGVWPPPVHAEAKSSATARTIARPWKAVSGWRAPNRPALHLTCPTLLDCNPGAR